MRIIIEFDTNQTTIINVPGVTIPSSASPSILAAPEAGPTSTPINAGAAPGDQFATTAASLSGTPSPVANGMVIMDGGSAPTFSTPS